jgi:hypothetical protein
MSFPAVMSVEKGEEVVVGLVSGHIAGTGRYKLLAKKKKDGSFEWAHFVERDTGLKEKVYRGELSSKEELKTLIEVMNKTLTKIFGPAAEMKNGIPEVKNIFGHKPDNTIN